MNSFKQFVVARSALVIVAGSLALAAADAAQAGDKPNTCPPPPAGAAGFPPGPPPGQPPGGGILPPPPPGGPGFGPGFGHGPHMPPMLREADLNDDGSITHAEVDAFAKSRFEKADGNRNGTLDLVEFEVLRPAPPLDAPAGAPPPPMHGPEDAFKRADWNGDSKLTPEEFVAPLRGMAVFADADGDGVVAKDERGGRRPPP